MVSACRFASSGRRGYTGARGVQRTEAMPDSLRFVLILACLAGLAYGAIWALSQFPPQQGEIVKPLPHDAFQK